MTELVVLVGEDVGEENMARMRRTHPDVTFHLCPTEAEYRTMAPQADIIFSKRFPADAVAAAQRLQWIQAGTAGVNHLLEMHLAERDILLTNANGAHGTPMSELILAQMLAFASGLHTLIRAQQEHKNMKAQVIRDKFELAGQTLCVVGLGDIGGSLAQRAKHMGMRVLGVRRSQTRFPGLDAQFTREELLKALPQADHVALCLPLTAETYHIVDSPELQAMPSSAYIYNVGRGTSIAPEALIRALQEGWIAGAGLDVTDPEPLPADSPLWDMPNVILSQHTSGDSPFNAERITSIFLDNLDRFRRNEPLNNIIDHQRGY